MKRIDDGWYPELTPRQEAVLDVLAPLKEHNGVSWGRCASFEFPGEVSPTPEDLLEMADEILASLDRVADQ